jgi:hypothetical protein
VAPARISPRQPLSPMVFEVYDWRRVNQVRELLVNVTHHVLHSRLQTFNDQTLRWGWEFEGEIHFLGPFPSLVVRVFNSVVHPGDAAAFGTIADLSTELNKEICVSLIGHSRHIQNDLLAPW